jgi:hypothetical protein
VLDDTDSDSDSTERQLVDDDTDRPPTDRHRIGSVCSLSPLVMF